MICEHCLRTHRIVCDATDCTSAHTWAEDAVPAACLLLQWHGPGSVSPLAEATRWVTQGVLERLPATERESFVTNLNTSLKEHNVRTWHAEFQTQASRPFIPLSQQLYPLLYDLLSSLPSELIRLICAYHSHDTITRITKLLRVRPKPMGRACPSQLVPLSDRYFAQLNAVELGDRGETAGVDKSCVVHVMDVQTGNCVRTLQNPGSAFILSCLVVLSFLISVLLLFRFGLFYLLFHRVMNGREAEGSMHGHFHFHFHLI
jgi:hypothetical protein